MTGAGSYAAPHRNGPVSLRRWRFAASISTTGGGQPVVAAWDPSPSRPLPTALDSTLTGTFEPPSLWDVRRRTVARLHGPARTVLWRVRDSPLAE